MSFGDTNRVIADGIEPAPMDFRWLLRLAQSTRPERMAAGQEVAD